MELEMFVSAGVHYGKGARAKKVTTFTIWSINGFDVMPATFPSQKRILELAEENLPGHPMEILVASAGIDNLIVRLPVGTRQKQRVPFLVALGRETKSRRVRRGR